MTSSSLFQWGIIMAILLSGCSIDISQPIIGGSESSLTSQAGSPNQSSKNIPVVWKNLDIKGKLVYITSRFENEQNALVTLIAIQVLDLADGNVKTIFEAPPGAWIDFLSVSPDGKQLVMEYVPAGNNASVGAKQTLLYTMPLDGSQSPSLLLPPPTSSDLYYQPTWSPDGRYIYYSHVNLRASNALPGQKFPDYELSRIAYPQGQPEKLLDQAFWPRLSTDGVYLSYVSVDPVDGSNRLFTANANGADPHQVALSGPYIPTIIDAPFFSPEGQTIYFSAATQVQSSTPSWVDKVFGITIASAHVVPSDLWSVPTTGGTPAQLTHIASFGLFASLSPDNEHIALYTGGEISAMNSDGSDLTTLVKDTGGIPGSVSWIP
jgi:Tol biopolymer transport system component